MHPASRIFGALVGASFSLALACGGSAQVPQPCSLADNGDGSYTLSCPDGTKATIRNGTDGTDGTAGTSCTVDPNPDGTSTISCEDGTTVTVSDGRDAASIVVRLDPVDGGEECATGGTAVKWGHDTDGDGTLSDAEVESTSVVCNGATGAAGETGAEALVSTSDEPAGDNCPAGGTLVRAGLDDDGDGVLSDAEVDSTRYVCNGIDGQDGTTCTVADNGDGTKTLSCTDGTEVVVSDGADGASCTVTDNGDGTKTVTCADGTSVVIHDGADAHDSLVRTVPIDAGAECASGGVAVESGVDGDGDGVLSDTEVAQTTYLCNGETGTDGAAALVALVPEQPGGHCTAGGTAVRSGYDLDGDGVLSDGEVTQTAYVCNGLSATPLELGFHGFDAVTPSERSPVSVDARLLQDPGVPVRWRLTLDDGSGTPVAGARAYYFSGAQDEDPADPSTWTHYIETDAAGRTAFGPAAGFPAADLFTGVTTTFDLLIADGGTYDLAVDLLNADTGEVIDGGHVAFTLIAPRLRLAFEGLDGLFAAARGPVSVQATLREDPGVPVRWRLTFTDDAGAPVEGARAYYFSGAAGEDPADSSTFVNAIASGADGVAYFGPAGGFPATDLLAGVTTLFDVEVATAGSYHLALDLVDATTGEVIAGGAAPVAVAENLSVSFSGFDAVFAGSRSPVSVTSVLAADPAGLVRWRLVLTDASGSAVQGARAYYFSGAAGEVAGDSSTFTGYIETDVDGVAWFGPASGFPATDLLTSVTTPFDVEIADAGSYRLDLELVDVGSGAVIGTGTRSFGATALGLVNPGFEVWTTDTSPVPVGWTADAGVAVERESTVVHNGAYAAKLTRAGTANSDTDFQSGFVPVTEGASYTVSAWFNDVGPDASGRIVAFFFDRNLVQITSGSFYGSYSTDNAGWEEVSNVVTAPAGAAFVTVGTRVYTSGAATGGFIYADDFRVTAS